MRYRFADQIVSLVLGDSPRIEVAKRFSPDDDVLGGPRVAGRVPESMLLELMAMTAGQLLYRHLGQSRLPLLLKVPECRFERVASAGDELRAVARLRGVEVVADGTCVAEAETAVSAVDAPLAQATLMFVCVETPPGERTRGTAA